MTLLDKCEKCGSTERLTLDHRVPKWLRGKLRDNARIRMPKIPPEQTLCYKCNQRKAGTIDFKDPLVRAFMLKVANRIIEECNSN